MKRTLAMAAALALWGAAGVPVNASAGSIRHGRASGPVAAGAHTRKSRGGELVAVQPFEGANAVPLRALVSRIVRGRGLRPITSLPHYEGTGQYPEVAREHHLAAFVTGDVEERGKWSSITFLVWSGRTGSVVGRWTASAPTPSIARAVGKGFWQHLGPVVLRSAPPPLPLDQDRAPTMHIDASPPQASRSQENEPLAAR